MIRRLLPLLRWPSPRVAAGLGTGSCLLAAASVSAQPTDAGVGTKPAPSAPAAQGSPAAPQLVRERHVLLRVDDPTTASDAVAALARELDGELEAQRADQIVIRIPERQMDAALGRLRQLGTVSPQTGSTQEVAWQRAELLADLRSAELTAERLRALLERAKGVDDSLLVERALARVSGEIARLQAALLALRRQSELVRLSVRVQPRQTPSHEAVPPVTLPFPWLHDLGLTNLLDTSRRLPPGDADEPPSQIQSNLDVGIQLEGRQLSDRPWVGENRYAVTFAARSRGVIDTDPVGWALGTELALGGGEGFVYEAALLLGLGASAGEVSSIGLLGGLGVSGWTGRGISESLELPVELFATVELGDSGRVILFAQPQWTPTTKSRQGGADPSPLGDELSLGGALLVPALIGSDELEDGGMRLGFVYTRLLDTEMYLVTAGLGLGVVQR